MPSRMDGSKPPDWEGFPPNPLDIPEVEIISDSEESIWGLTNPLQHSPTFIQQELRERRIEENLEHRNRADRRQRERERRALRTIRQIRLLNEVGEEANDDNYNWDFHNDQMADLLIMRDNLIRQIVMHRRRRERNNRTQRWF